MKCPPWYDVMKRELAKENPDVSRICALMTVDQIEETRRYFVFEDYIYDKYGIENDFVRANVSMNAVANLLQFSPDSEVRVNATDKIVKALKMDRRVTRKDVDLIMQVAPKNTPRKAVDPAVIRLPANPQITLVNAPTNGRKEILSQFYKLAGKSIGVYEELAKKEGLDDEYAAFIAGVGIIQKYLNGELVEI